MSINIENARALGPAVPALVLVICLDSRHMCSQRCRCPVIVAAPIAMGKLEKMYMPIDRAMAGNNGKSMPEWPAVVKRRR